MPQRLCVVYGIEMSHELRSPRDFIKYDGAIPHSDRAQWFGDYWVFRRVGQGATITKRQNLCPLTIVLEEYRRG